MPIDPNSSLSILSPDQSNTKLITKIQTCLQEGTQLGWLLDPSEQVIMVILPENRLALLRNSVGVARRGIAYPSSKRFP